MLDCKVPRCQELAADLPAIGDVASEASRSHVDRVEAQLHALGITFVRNPRLVRGLDYYLRTVFEVVSPQLGAGTVLCGGGRYDRLISDLGGPAMPGVGFAIGEDRLVEVLPEHFAATVLTRPRLLLVGLGDAAQDALLPLALAWQRQGVPVELELGGRSLKAALRRADKDGFRAVAIVGDDELAAGEVTVKDLAASAQERIAATAMPEWWRAKLAT